MLPPVKDSAPPHDCTDMDTECDSLDTRSSLLRRLQKPDAEEAWTEFCARYAAVVQRVARRAGLREEDSADVVQEVMLSLSKALPQFEYRPDQCSFRTWLFRVIRARIIDHRRRENRRGAIPFSQLESDHGSDALESLVGVDESSFQTIWENEWKETVWRQALDEIRQRVSPRQFQIYEAVVLKEWPVKTACSRLGVNSAQVYLARHRVTRALRAEVARLTTVLG